jgi:hypothetical protein
MQGYIPGKRKMRRPKRRCVQDIMDELQISASDAKHVAYDRVVFRRVVKEAKFRQGQATE